MPSSEHTWSQIPRFFSLRTGGGKDSSTNLPSGTLSWDQLSHCRRDQSKSGELDFFSESVDKTEAFSPWPIVIGRPES